MNIKKNYKWKISLDQKTFIEFIKEYGLENELIDLTKTIVLLSYILDLYNHSNKLNVKIISGKKFIHMSNRFVIDNVPTLGIGTRQLSNYFENLSRNGFIEIFIENNCKRYIKIDDEILKSSKYKTIEEPNDNYQDFDNETELPDYLVGLAVELEDYFGMTQKHQIRFVDEFVLGLGEDLEIFEKQFLFYKIYKDAMKEKKHKFPRYIEVWNDIDYKSLYSRDIKGVNPTMIDDLGNYKKDLWKN